MHVGFKRSLDKATRFRHLWKINPAGRQTESTNRKWGNMNMWPQLSLPDYVGGWPGEPFGRSADWIRKSGGD